MNLIEELTYYQTYTDHYDKEQFYKRCYELCIQANWEMPKLEELTKDLPIKARLIRNHARDYALNYLHITEEDFNKMIYHKLYATKQQARIQNYRTDHYLKLLDRLVTTTDKNQIITLIDTAKTENHIGITHLKKRIIPFVFDFYPDQNTTLIQSLENKIALYVTYQKEQASTNSTLFPLKSLPNQSLLAEAQHYLTNYINSNIIKLDCFCRSNHLTLKYFNQLVDYIQKYDPKLYEQYTICYQNKYQFYSTELTKTTKYIISLIQQGITENGITRDFNFIDYYTTFNISFEEILKFTIPNLTADEIRTIKKFIRTNNRPENLKQITKIKDTKEIKIGYQLTKDDPTPYYPTDEEISLLITFMMNIGIPLNRYNYSIVLKEYLHNTINPNQYVDKHYCKSKQN